MDWKKVLLGIFGTFQLHIHSDCVLSLQDGAFSDEQKDATQVESYVVQRYIENPYLINGDKQMLPCAN